ncbi:MAG: sugar phosphate isomerase/epimerase [Chloroflexota bacterium]|nr:sugar phosphate isomerase/epimerase [Chloroflexota bacterium]
MKVAYQTITWGGVVGHPAGVTSVKDLHYLANGPTEDALREIAGAGYGGVELFDGNLAQYAGREQDLRGLLGELGLELVAVYAGANFIYPDILGEELAKIEGAAALAANLGATHLVVGGGAVRAMGMRDDDYRLLADGLDRVVDLAGRVGLTPSFHPHLGTCAISPEQIARLFERTGIGFCPDTAHLAAGGGNPAALIRTYGDRMPYVHLKDYDYADGTFLPLGRGQLEWAAIFEALQAVGYDGWITVELDAYDGAPAEAARTSRSFLEETLTRRNT